MVHDCAMGGYWALVEVGAHSEALDILGVYKASCIKMAQVSTTCTWHCSHKRE